ncbi:MAG: PIN domain-containing protein [Bacteroidetes bacterium]|nr:PIN domain-containing protein [Bacteroidota bacterium]MBU2583710.1 PIN domain-containing protein [Bacteroidota bacterium]
MKIYLDTCCLQRPFDNKTQVKIRLEAEAVLGILNFYEKGIVQIVSSEVLFYELSRIPNIIRRVNSLKLLEKIPEFISLNRNVEKRARFLHKSNIQALDALHLASADIGRADYFCTCDESLMKKARRMNFMKMKILTPIELIGVIEL